ncbi:MAG TPA: amino acid permease [Pyrinomonadaceae bacterium]
MTTTTSAAEAADKDGGRLERGLGLLDATTIVVGSMIGSGVFIASAESARLVGSPGWLLAAWALAGLLTITGALCCAELAAMMPRAGGQYVFLREAYGPGLGFLFGWSLFLVIQTGTIAAVAVAFARFTGVLFPWVSAERHLVAPVRLSEGYAVSLSAEQLVAVLLILLLTFTNTLGLRTGRLIQNAFTFTKTAALAGLVVVGLAVGWSGASAAYTSDWWNPWANGWTPQGAQADLGAAGALALVMLLGRAMTGPLFAQSAWNNVTFTGSEVRDPARNLPRALLAGCGAVVCLYLLANLAYVVTLPLAVMQKPPNSIATASVSAAVGPAGVTLMAAAIMVSTFGCNNGLILAGARVTYAMACDRLFFRGASRLNARRVPAVALAAQGAWAALLTLPRTVTTAVDPATGAARVAYGNVYTQLLEYIIPADLVFYVLMVGAVAVLRRKSPDAPRPYRTPGYPLAPAVYVLLATLLVLDLVYLAPGTSGIGFLLVLTGLPVYLVWRGRAARGGA